MLSADNRERDHECGGHMEFGLGNAVESESRKLECLVWYCA